jgi:hypothetical protein
MEQWELTAQEQKGLLLGIVAWRLKMTIYRPPEKPPLTATEARVVALRPSWMVAEEVLSWDRSPKKHRSSPAAYFPHHSQNHQIYPPQLHYDERKEGLDFGLHLETCRRNYYRKKGMG